jgi:hypothetical protein
MKKVFSILVLILSIIYVVGRVAVNDGRYKGVSKAGPAYEIDEKFQIKFAKVYRYDNTCGNLNNKWQFLFQEKGEGKMIYNLPICNNHTDTLTFRYRIINEKIVSFRFNKASQCLIASECGFHLAFEKMSFSKKLMPSKDADPYLHQIEDLLILEQ